MLKKVSLLHFAQYIKNIWRVPDGKGVLGFFSLYVGGGVRFAVMVRSKKIGHHLAYFS